MLLSLSKLCFEPNNVGINAATFAAYLPLSSKATTATVLSSTTAGEASGFTNLLHAIKMSNNGRGLQSNAGIRDEKDMGSRTMSRSKRNKRS